MNILKAGYGKRVKAKQIYLSVGLLLGLIFSAVFCNETMAYAAEWTSGISYAYNPYNNSLLGLNLNGNSVIIVESDTEGEFNLYLDSDKDGVIDTDEKMLGIQNGPDTAVTSFPETFYLYGVYNTTLDDSIFITMKSGSVGGIYGVYSSDSTYNAAIHGSVSITMKNGELNNIYGVYNGSVSSESGDAVSIDVLDGNVRYDMTGSYNSYVVAPEGYNAIDISVSDDAILGYGFYGVNGQSTSGSYGVVGDVTISTIGGLKEGRIDNPNLYAIQNASVDGNLEFTHLGGDINILGLVKGTLNGSVVANIAACETGSVRLFEDATILGDVTVNQKATVNTNVYYIGDGGSVSGNVIANLYGETKEDVFAYHYHLFKEFNIGGNLDLLVSGGNIDCLIVYNEGSIGGSADIDIVDVKNPDAGFVGEGCLTGITVGKDVTINVDNSEFTGFMALNNTKCLGNATVNINDSLFRNYVYAAYNGVNVTGDFECTLDGLNVEEYLYAIYGATFQKDANITLSDCETPEIVAVSGSSKVIDGELCLNINDCVADKVSGCSSLSSVEEVTINIQGGIYGENQETKVYNTILGNGEYNDKISLNMNDVTFGEYSEINISGQGNTSINISNSDLGNYLSISGAVSDVPNKFVAIENSTVNDMSLSGATVYVADGNPLSIDGQLDIYGVTDFILEDELSVGTMEKATYGTLNIYYNGGNSDFTEDVEIDNVYYAIAVDNFKNKAKVSGGDAITLSNIAERFFVKPGDVAELTVTPLTGVEISSLSAKAGSTDMTGEITYDKGICSFTMPEAVVTLDAVLAEKKEEKEEHKHTFDTQWSTDETHHWYKCTDAACSEQKDKAEHTFDEGIVEKEASSTEAGVKKYTCTVCGYAKTEAIVATGVETLKVGTKITDKNSKATFEVSKAGLEVTYVKPTNSNAKTVTIPATIKKDGVTYKVTNIANKAFSGCKKLKKVTIGKNVKTIGSQAFYKCTSLKSITIPANVTKIGKKAFYGCKSLKTITFKTTKLTSKKVGSKAFTGTHSKAKVNVPKKKYKAYKKMLKNKGMSKKAVYKKK